MGLTDDEWGQIQANLAAGRAKSAQVAQEATIAAPAKKAAKYRNKPVLVDLGPHGEVVNGHLRLVHTFQSQREADYYADLKMRQLAGDVGHLRLQEPFALIVQRPDGQPRIVGEWLADFVFDGLLSGTRHIVDAKGVKTHLYILKKKIVEACHGITIEEV